MTAGAEPDPPPPAARRRRGIPLIWLVPVVALLVGVLLAVRAVLQSGPTITLAFRNAEGIEAGTELRYKEVVVGRVNAVQLGPSQNVLVTATLDAGASRLAVADSRFWVVRPRVGIAGISGLGTLFSGSYIGVDAGESSTAQRSFEGLETPPFVLRGEPGRSFVLAADDLGSLEVGSPVYYRRARVGRVVGYELDPARDTLDVRVFVEAPNDTLVTTASRFWNASGIAVDVNAGGFSASAQSIASVLVGGIAFANPTSGAQPAPEGQRFWLAGSRDAALAPPQGAAQRVRMLFRHSLRGLEPGAPLDLLGLDVGTVRSVALQAARDGRPEVEVVADLYPSRLGALHQAVSGDGDDARFVRRLVDAGLRAQLRSGNLLTGQLYVALDFAPPGAAKRTVAAAEAPADAPPRIPTLPGSGSLGDLQPQLAEILAKVNQVRFDEIGRSVERTLQGATAATGTLQDTLKDAGAASRTLRDTLAAARDTIQALSPEAQRTLADARRTLERAEALLGGLERSVAQPDAPLQRNASQALVELQRAAQAMRQLGDYLQRHPEALLRGKPADPALSGSAR